MNQKWDLRHNPSCRRRRIAMKLESPSVREAVAFADGSSCEAVIVAKQPLPSRQLKDEDRGSCELRHHNTGDGLRSPASAPWFSILWFTLAAAHNRGSSRCFTFSIRSSPVGTTVKGESQFTEGENQRNMGVRQIRFKGKNEKKNEKRKKKGNLF